MTEHPPHQRPARLRRRLRGVEALLASTRQRLAKGVDVPPAAESHLDRAGELVARARPLVQTDPERASACLDEARELAAAASRIAQDSLEWTQAPPSYGERLVNRELREFQEYDGGEGLLGWLFGPG